jgi:hypothetical protein
MKNLFPIFVLLCIGFVVIGSRASRPVPTGAATTQADVKAGESQTVLQASKR